MKLSLRLILFLVAGMSVITFIVSKNEVRWQKRGLRADLERRAEILGESLQEVVEPALERRSGEDLHRVVQRFENQEQLIGIIVYDAKGNTLAESSNLAQRINPPPLPL